MSRLKNICEKTKTCFRKRFLLSLKKSDFVGHILRYLFTAPVWQKRIDRIPDFQAFPITCLTHIGSDHCSRIRRTGGKYAYCRCSKQSAAELYVYINGCVRSSSIREERLVKKLWKAYPTGPRRGDYHLTHPPFPIGNSDRNIFLWTRVQPVQTHLLFYTHTHTQE